MKDLERDPLAQLLRLADTSTHEVRPAIARRARMAVEMEWRRGLRTRRRRRLVIGAGLGAALAAAAALVLWLHPPWNGEAGTAPAAEVMRGSLTVSGQAVDIGTRLTLGSELRTKDNEGAALRLADGRSVRLAPNTHVRLTGSAHLDLDAGALYVDSPPDIPGLDTLVIRTPHGEARNLATQFELRVTGDSMRLRVREGRVSLATPGQDLVASTGMEITWTPGRVETAAVPVRGDLWRPYVDLAHFELESASLGEFLEWVRRETGLAIEWSDPSLALTLRDVRLHGSLRDTPPDLAPAVVLPTCGLTSRIDHDTLRLSLLIPDPRSSK